ncbi:MAG: hypothetical protein V3S26_01305, partial [Acidimicrobiia bacterium]
MEAIHYIACSFTTQGAIGIHVVLQFVLMFGSVFVDETKGFNGGRPSVRLAFEFASSPKAVESATHLRTDMGMGDPRLQMSVGNKL